MAMVQGECPKCGKRVLHVNVELIVGIAMDVSVFFIPAGYRPLIAFAVVIIALLLRPEGLSMKRAS